MCNQHDVMLDTLLVSTLDIHLDGWYHASHNIGNGEIQKYKKSTVATGLYQLEQIIREL